MIEHDSDPYVTWDAAYVLGALAPDERREFQQHLTTCDRCRDAVADLAGIPGMLALVPRADALAMVDDADRATLGHLPPPPPDGLLDRLVAEAERKRRRGRLLAIGGAVAAAAAAVLIAIPIVRVDNEPSRDPGAPTEFAVRDMSQIVPSPISADFTLTTDPTGGTRVRLNCRYDGAGSAYAATYAMVVTNDKGVESRLATWPAPKPGEKLSVPAFTSDAPDTIRKVDIRSAQTGQIILVGNV